MSKFPQPFWAILLAALGVILALAGLLRPTPENICLAVLAIASNLVSGALGAFAGHAQAQAEKTSANPTNPQ